MLEVREPSDLWEGGDVGKLLVAAFVGEVC